MLEIDHIYNDGNVERREVKGSYALCKKILRMDSPTERYQILCGSCNKSKHRNKGTCEHKTTSHPSRVDRFVSRLNADCGTNPDRKPLAAMMLDSAYREFLGLS